MDTGFKIKHDPIYGCWLWQGPTDKDGYPRGKAYRDGLADSKQEIDHLCRRRNCLRPGHHEGVSKTENLRRMQWRYRAKMRTCPKGHDLFTNGRRTPEGGKVCLICAPVEEKP